MDDPHARVFCALDVNSLAEAVTLAGRVGPHVGGMKVGLELFVREGPAAVRALRPLTPRLFLDLKLHDIPQTVARAVESAAALGADFLTVHAAAGRRALSEAVRASAGSPLRLLAVTVLTSLDAEDLAELGAPHAVADQVERLAQLAADTGVPGLVCSPRELIPLRRRWPVGQLLLVTPGIRPRTSGDDQKRTLSPVAALDAGADHLVVGRPITEAADPAAAARTLFDQSLT